MFGNENLFGLEHYNSFLLFMAQHLNLRSVTCSNCVSPIRDYFFTIGLICSGFAVISQKCNDTFKYRISLNNRTVPKTKGKPYTLSFKNLRLYGSTQIKLDHCTNSLIS